MKLLFLPVRWLRPLANLGLLIVSPSMVLSIRAAAPVFVQQPENAMVFLGQSARLTAEVTGSPSLTYQWRFNGQALAGQTNSILQIVAAAPSQQGGYTLDATSDEATTTSRVATVTVAVPDFSLIAPIGLQSLTAYRGQDGRVVIATVTGTASGGLWGTDIYTDDSLLPSVAVHTGLLTNGQVGTLAVRILSGQPQYIGSTRHGVSSLDFPSYPGSYELMGLVATITQHPVSRAAFAGETVVFDCSIESSAPVTYQWVRNGVPLAGENKSILVVPDVSPDVSGSYAVRVTMAGIPNTSQLAQLIVIPASSPVLQIDASDSLTDLLSFPGKVIRVPLLPQTRADERFWGTGIYTSDSPVGSAALHLGLWHPGEARAVTLVSLPGQSSYASSSRNGIQSQSYERWPLSYAFVESIPYFLPACANISFDIPPSGRTNATFCALRSGRLTIRDTDNDSIELSWRSLPETYYLLQVSDSLTSANWTDFGTVQTGNGAILNMSDASRGRPHRFYRLMATEP